MTHAPDTYYRDIPTTTVRLDEHGARACSLCGATLHMERSMNVPVSEDAAIESFDWSTAYTTRWRVECEQGHTIMGAGDIGGDEDPTADYQEPPTLAQIDAFLYRPVSPDRNTQPEETSNLLSVEAEMHAANVDYAIASEAQSAVSPDRNT